MFDHLKIRQYRALSNLEINSLSRINLIAGQNNTGKTTLLEALFLLSGAGNPEIVLKINSVRGTQSTVGRELVETSWKPIFTELDVTRSVEIVGHHKSLGVLTLKVAISRPETVEFSHPRISDAGNTTETELSSRSSLLFSFKQGSRKRATGEIRPARDGVEIKAPSLPPPFPAAFLASRIGNFKEDAKRLGQLRKRKQGALLLKALQIIEPRLQSIEDNSASGVPMIWGDIGLSELVPISVMGEGMGRIARLVLAISAAPKGMLLVDEIENGLHHSVLGKVWKAVQEAATQFNTQIFATTHSIECVDAAHKSLDMDKVAFHRLEVHEEAIFCVSYGPSEIKAALDHGLEVR